MAEGMHRPVPARQCGQRPSSCAGGTAGISSRSRGGRAFRARDIPGRYPGRYLICAADEAATTRGRIRPAASALVTGPPLVPQARREGRHGNPRHCAEHHPLACHGPLQATVIRRPGTHTTNPSRCPAHHRPAHRQSARPWLPAPQHRNGRGVNAPGPQAGPVDLPLGAGGELGSAQAYSATISVDKLGMETLCECLESGCKEERYVFPYRPSPVLVPRLLQLAANERVDQEGKVRSPLDEANVPAAAGRFREAGVGLSRLASPGRSDRRARAPRRRRPSGGTPGCLCQRLVRGAAPNPGVQPRGTYSGNRVAGSGLDRAPRE